jgi:hypothetical protein
MVFLVSYKGKGREIGGSKAKNEASGGGRGRGREEDVGGGILHVGINMYLYLP